MMTRFRQPTPCDNLNHRRANPPVSHCPQCGGLVNNRVRAQPCSDTHHATERRQMTVFCIDCGLQLIVDR